MSPFGRARNSQSRTSPRAPGCEALERRCLLALSPVTVSGPMLWDKDALVGDLEPKGERPYVADQVVVALNADLKATDFRGDVSEMAWPDSLPLGDFGKAEFLLASNKDAQHPVTLVNLSLKAGSDVPAAVSALESLSQVAWAAPNYLYVGADPREFTPNDPQYANQYHHPLMQNNLAWDTTLGSPNVIIAITDDGVSYTHNDLAPNIWANDDPINGVDDDGNGRIDDVRGWDFIDGDNNPNHDNGDNHGSHVAGIAAGRTNNGLGISGTAGGSTIMPVRFYGSSEGWNAAEIAASFAYSVDNGAKIVSTSYNIDGWVGDPTFTAGLQYIYDQGALHFNSAGNNGQLNPPRQVFHQSLFVASTNNLDVRDSSSNYGTGIDIAAPGANILSTIPTNQYAVFSGTSMATPNAAGVAALVWSAHPTWTRDQVAAQVTGTAVNIDAQNASIAGLLGHGRVNSFKAVTESIAPPTIEGVVELPPDGGTITTAPTVLTVQLGSVFDTATVINPANWELRGDGPDNAFGTPDDTLIPLTQSIPYMIGTNDLTFSIASLPADRYRFQAKVGLTDPFGQALDGDSNGTPGQAYSRIFTFERQLPIGVVSPLGGLAYQGSISETTVAAATTYAYETVLPAGQNLSLVAAPVAGSPVITLSLMQGATVLSTTTTGPGQTAILPGISIPTSGGYTVRVQSSTTNGFTLTGYLQEAFEAESNGGAANNSIATAQSIESSSVGLAPGADRLAVVGRTETTNPDMYSFSLQAGQAVSMALHRAGTASISLQLQDSVGNVLATGATGFTNVSASVQDFIAPAAGTYFARVAGTANQTYSLIVTRGAAFGLETTAAAYTQALTATTTVLGHNGVPPITTESEPNDDGLIGASPADLVAANDLSGSFVLSGSQYVATVTGSISVGNDGDWDFFRFYAKPGDTLQLDLDGISLGDSFLHLVNNLSVELASDDDSGPGTDAQIIYSNFPYAGDYYIAADSYSSNTGTYSLTARLTTNAITVGSDVDRYSYSMVAGETVTWQTATPDYGFNSNLNPKLELYDSTNALVASNDNGAPDGRNARLTYQATEGGTYTIRVLGASGIGSYVLYEAAADATPPTLAGVGLGSTSSTHADYTVPVGNGEQLRTVPVAKLDTISIAFNEDVSVDSSDLTVSGVNVPNYPVFGFIYDSGTHVATWSLTTPIDDDRITLTLDDSVTDISGNPLDGEWDNPTSLGDPSSSTTAGNGVAGGDFVFQFTSLPGDANRDNHVTGADFTIWADHFDGGSGPGGKTFIQGDFTGDGFVTGADYTAWADHFNVVFSIAPRPTSGTQATLAAEARPQLAPTLSAKVAEPVASAPVAKSGVDLTAGAARRTRTLRAVDDAFATLTDFRRDR